MVGRTEIKRHSKKKENLLKKIKFCCGLRSPTTWRDSVHISRRMLYSISEWLSHLDKDLPERKLKNVVVRWKEKEKNNDFHINVRMLVSFIKSPLKICLLF